MTSILSKPETKICLSLLIFIIILIICRIIYLLKRTKKLIEQHKTNQQRNEELEKIITSIYLQNINTYLITKGDSPIKKDSQVLIFYEKERTWYDKVVNFELHTFPRAYSFRKFIKYDSKLIYEYQKGIGQIRTEKQQAFFNIYVDFIVGLGKHFIITVSDCLISDIKAFIPKEKKEELLIEVDVLKKELNSMFVDFYLDKQINIDTETVINAIHRYYKIIFAILDTFIKENETVTLGYYIIKSKYIKTIKICEKNKEILKNKYENSGKALFFYTNLHMQFKKDVLYYIDLMDIIYKEIEA